MKMMIIDNNDDSYSKNPCKKYRDFTLFLGVEILWKGTVSTWFQVHLPKLYKNRAFPQHWLLYICQRCGFCIFVILMICCIFPCVMITKEIM